jgi:hypothetical protein
VRSALICFEEKEGKSARRVKKSEEEAAEKLMMIQITPALWCA